MRKIKSKVGNITVHGVNFISTDCIVEYIRDAFEKFTTPDEIADYIGKHFGQKPRNVFMDKREVIFTSF